MKTANIFLTALVAATSVLMAPAQSVNCDPAADRAFAAAECAYRRGDACCQGLLKDFYETYPASPFANKARLTLGDYYFFRHDWPDALEAYRSVNLDRLNRDNKALYAYRTALAMIKTGHFEEAAHYVKMLRGRKDYVDAYNFYTAYLDYIAGRFKDAYARFEKVDPDVPGLDAGYYMTQIEYTWGRYADVIAHGRSLLYKRPNPELAPEIERIVGLSYFKQENPDVAWQFLDNYVQHHDGTPADDALYALGAIDYGRGNYRQALERLEPLSGLQNELGQGALLYIGQCYLQLDNPSAAAMAFEKASRLNFDPKVTETAMYNYVTALTRGGKVPFSSASSLLENFASAYPDSEYTPEVEAYLATAYFNDRAFARALQSIDAIRTPTASQLAMRQKILYELGIECITNGRQQEAVGYLQQAVGLRRCDAALAAQASLWLGDALFSLGRFGDAQKAYEAFTSDRAATDNRALGYYDLAYAKYKQKNYAGAAADFAAALAARPGLQPQLADDARIRRADCLYYTGKYAEATSLFTQAIEAGANDADYALYRRALLRGLAGDRNAKIADLVRLESDFPDSRWLSKALLEQAVTYEDMGRNDKAADAYRRRLATTADVDVDELLRMAASMHRAERWADLLDVVERVRHAGGLEADEMAELSLCEADALDNLGRRAEATEIYTRLAETPTSLPGSQAVVRLAESELTRGNYSRARDLMEEFTDAGTPHQYWLARGFIALADAYKGLGEKSLAREYLILLRDNYPGSGDDIPQRIAQRLK